MKRIWIVILCAISNLIPSKLWSLLDVYDLTISQSCLHAKIHFSVVAFDLFASKSSFVISSESTICSTISAIINVLFAVLLDVMWNAARDSTFNKFVLLWIVSFWFCADEKIERTLPYCSDT